MISTESAEAYDLDSDFERRLAGCLILDPSQIDATRAIVGVNDFLDARARAVFEVLTEADSNLVNADGMIDIFLLCRTLESRGLLKSLGGPAGVSELASIEAVASYACQYAREVKKAAIKREIQRHLSELQRHPDDAEAHAFLGERYQQLRELEVGLDAATHGQVGLTGSELVALANQPDPESPLPGYLDPEPSLHILHGVAKTGKTTLAWLLGLAWATSRPPWDGAPRLPGTRVLVLSGEQGTRKCLRVLRRIALTADLGKFEEWRERITIVGRRSDMSAIDRRILRLDADGIEAIRRVIQSAEKAGDPFGLIVADSLSRLKPSSAKTNENDDMVAVLDPLAALATELGVYVLLIHHDGHNADRQGQAVDGVRGASAIRDVPQVLIAVSRVANDPRKRMVRVAGNELPDLAQSFEVATEWEPEGYINRFTPDLNRAPDIDSVFENGPLNLTDFGRRALGWAPDRAPSGGAKDKARALLNDFEYRGVIKKEGQKWRLVKD